MLEKQLITRLSRHLRKVGVQSAMVWRPRSSAPSHPGSWPSMVQVEVGQRKQADVFRFPLRPVSSVWTSIHVPSLNHTSPQQLRYVTPAVTYVGKAECVCVSLAGFSGVCVSRGAV